MADFKVESNLLFFDMRPRASSYLCSPTRGIVGKESIFFEPPKSIVAISMQPRPNKPDSPDSPNKPDSAVPAKSTSDAFGEKTPIDLQSTIEFRRVPSKAEEQASWSKPRGGAPNEVVSF